MKYNLNKLLLAIVGLFLSTTALAHDFEVDGIYYNYLDKSAKTVAVTSGAKRYTGSVIIPSSVTYNGTTYSVTEIGDYAFDSRWFSLGMAKYTDDFVASLFDGVEPVTYEVEIQENADKPGMYRLVNPYGAAYPYNEDGDWDTSKDYYLEINAQDPQGVYIETQELGFDWGYGMFLASSMASQYLVNYDLETIKGAGYCGTLADGVITFPAKALLVTAAQIDGFYYANVNGAFKVELPSASKSIKSAQIEKNMAITKDRGLITLNKNSQRLQQIKTLNKSTFINPNHKVMLNNNVSDDHSELTSVTIPNSVTIIGKGAFRYCTGLTSVTIPNSVSSIGDRAFEDCTGLTEVNYNAENCTSTGSISNPAFSDCSNLKTLNIGNEVKYIPSYAFYGCTGLTEVTIPNSVTEIGWGAFYYCTGLTSVTIPNSVTEIGISAFANCTGLTSVTIPNSVTSISDYAFSDCTGLTSITIPNSVTEIGDRAFYNTAWYNNQADGVVYINNVLYKYKGTMPMGTSISIKDGSVSISPYAFYDCSDLTSVTIPNSVTEIGRWAFRYCTGLTSITIPNSVTEIGESTFSGCSNLKSVTLGKSVVSIDKTSFYGCKLRLIMSHCVTPPTCSEGTFDGSYTALLMIPEGSLIDYALADEWHKFTQVHEVSEAKVSTEEKSATFEIPTIEGATQYLASVYSDASMSQLVATTHYDAYGKIIPMSTSLELSIDGFDNGIYYYKVLVKSAEGEILKNYIGTFEIDAAGVENIATDDAVEVSRYDIHGRLLNDPTRGINIVIYSDGTTKKEIIKE